MTMKHEPDCPCNDLVFNDGLSTHCTCDAPRLDAFIREELKEALQQEEDKTILQGIHQSWTHDSGAAIDVSASSQPTHIADVNDALRKITYHWPCVYGAGENEALPDAKDHADGCKVFARSGGQVWVLQNNQWIEVKQQQPAKINWPSTPMNHPTVQPKTAQYGPWEGWRNRLLDKCVTPLERRVVERVIKRASERKSKSAAPPPKKQPLPISHDTLFGIPVYTDDWLDPDVGVVVIEPRGDAHISVHSVVKDALSMGAQNPDYRTYYNTLHRLMKAAGSKEDRAFIERKTYRFTLHFSRWDREDVSVVRT